MESLVHGMLSNAAAVAVLAVLVAIAGRVCRRPALIHSVCLLAMLKLVTPPVVPLPVPVPMPCRRAMARAVAAPVLADEPALDVVDAGAGRGAADRGGSRRFAPGRAAAGGHRRGSGPAGRLRLELGGDRAGTGAGRRRWRGGRWRPCGSCGSTGCSATSSRCRRSGRPRSASWPGGWACGGRRRPAWCRGTCRRCSGPWGRAPGCWCRRGCGRRSATTSGRRSSCTSWPT